MSYARIGTWFSVLLYAMVFGIGTLVGLELPLLMRILKENLDFKELVSRVLTFDYIGALVGSLMFPLFLLPKMGLIRTSLLFGMLNALVGLWGTWLLKPLLSGRTGRLRMRAGAVLLLLFAGFLLADRLTTLSEERLYPNPVVYAEQSPYQRIVVTSAGGKFQLWLNGKLQFDSRDEYRYHEALVHPAMQAAGSRRKVLVLGGGDGLGLREILKYAEVNSVTLVDLDPAMTSLSQNFPPLAELNRQAFADPRVKIINQDAMIWLEGEEEQFDVVIVRFPRPQQFRFGEIIHPAVLSHPETTLGCRGNHRHSMHFAFVRPQILLVHSAHDAGGGFCHAALSRGGSFLRALGVRVGNAPPLFAARFAALRNGLQVSHGRSLAHIVRAPGRHLAGGDRNQPPRQPNSGPLLRALLKRLWRVGLWSMGNHVGVGPIVPAASPERLPFSRTEFVARRKEANPKIAGHFAHSGNICPLSRRVAESLARQLRCLCFGVGND